MSDPQNPIREPPYRLEVSYVSKGQNNVNALIDMKLEKHKNLKEESGFYWQAISVGALKFDRREADVKTCMFEDSFSVFYREKGKLRDMKNTASAPYTPPH
ncbi:hypothetical protein CUMW_212850 [Citrus unshiu]|uniref:Uncharacterized protein n=1 Tax=Citrus unshiu TaxID=55188 RepID=A0A2H5QB50_CITUN|nr:hypothetical protein CUMW_212850 [Citrus unshiu]